MNLEKQSIQGGWGLPNQTEKEIIRDEKVAFADLAQNMPAKLMRAEPKTAKNLELLGKIKELQEADGIDEGFSFMHLEAALFGAILKYRPQLIGSCVASGGRIADVGRFLVETFVFNEPQDILGTTFQDETSFQPFAPFNYRLGRAIAGINGNSDGSLCAPHIRGKIETGYITCATPGLQSDAFPEPQNQRTYKQWGASNTLVNQFKEYTVAKLEESEKIKSGDNLKDVVVQHFKPLQICSMWAFEPKQKHPSWTMFGEPVWIYGRSRQQWAHNMTLYGVIKAFDNWYVIVKNTWGDQHKGRDFFIIPLEEAHKWLKQAEAMTIGNIEFIEQLASPL